jgi:hypothetical protein
MWKFTTALCRAHLPVRKIVSRDLWMLRCGPMRLVIEHGTTIRPPVRHRLVVVVVVVVGLSLTALLEIAGLDIATLAGTAAGVRSLLRTFGLTLDTVPVSKAPPSRG